MTVQLTLSPLQQNIALLYLASVLGLLAHYASKRFRREIQGSLFRYLFVDNKGYTAATFLALVAGCQGLIAAGQIDTAAPHIIGAMGFGVGWALDSAISPRAPDAGSEVIQFQGSSGAAP